MADEPLPDFLARRQGAPVDPAPSQPQSAETHAAQTQPIPALGPPAATPVPTGPPPQDAPPTADGRSPLALVAAVLLLALCAVGGFLVVDRLTAETSQTAADTTTSVASSSITTASSEPSTTPTTTVLSVEGNCPEAEQPIPGQRYRVVEIPASDPDGGLNARREPDVTAEVVLVFTSQSPVKVTGEHCEVDAAGRTWWSARSTGELVWVAARFLEPLE